jgi:hypothetical protein
LDQNCAAREVTLKGSGRSPVNLRQAAEMAILGQAARKVLPLSLGKDD